ncbi:DUF5131 family protein [Streptomyces sp. WSLK1-5]|uniref:DUF5131 family protein n=1 Tax=unclassified Streptomyces TaxID=2593676 RepID=UPI0037B52E1C
MADSTSIEWTDRTWNPVTGCTKLSPGCVNCYAENIAHRFAGTAAFPNGTLPVTAMRHPAAPATTTGLPTPSHGIPAVWAP